MTKHLAIVETRSDAAGGHVVTETWQVLQEDATPHPVGVDLARPEDLMFRQVVVTNYFEGPESAKAYAEQLHRLMEASIAERKAAGRARAKPFREVRGQPGVAEL